MLNSLYKYILLYLFFIISVLGLYYPINVFSEKGIELQKQILLKQAQTHFYDQVNTRKWNAMYGGVYVKPLKNQKPNLHLKNNILKVDENLTLIKINPAWMTRQLSEISDIKNFRFRITSLTPINPNNIATEFEKKALRYFERTDIREYHELGSDKLNYMGALVTIKACLPCHKHQGYKVGDIRGGISVDLDTSKYNIIINDIKENALIVKVFVLLFLVSITFLIHKQIKSNDTLQIQVQNRTKEIESTKQLLQKILDADNSFLVLTDGTDVIDVNKAVLNFFEFKSLEELKKKFPHFSDSFEEIDEENFLHHYIEGKHWIDYLQDKQDSKELKVLIKKDGINRYFKPHAKEIIVEDKIIHLVIFDEITAVYEKIQKLEKKASTDTLTKLFNRAKFDDVLNKEMELASTADSPFSIIFLDIDYFKAVNDNFGHDVGDEVLIELANILISTTRAGDFISRWGGEEFMITLQSTDVKQAQKLAQKLRMVVQEYKFKSAPKQTISLGVTQYINYEQKDTFLKRVDEALYEAKKGGRNMVAVK